MDIPADSVPLELKSSCEQILKRARELRKVDPVMSYWCCFSAATASMKLTTKRSHAGNQFLMDLLDVLEDMKKQLLSSDSGIETTTIVEESAGSAYVEDFAMKVFIQADNEDRAGKSDKHSIRKFMVASQFLQVLKCFEPPNGMREELEQKQQYAKWKATDIAKALREGRKPQAGPPLSEDEAAVNHLLPESNPTSGPSFPTIPFEEDFAASSSATVPPPKSIFAPDFRHLQNPDRQDSASSSSGAWSTVATPGLRDEDDGQSSLLATAATISRDVSPEAIGREIIDVDADQGEPVKKGVRFAGPDGAPLSPASTLLTLDSYAAPEGPPPSERDTSPTTAKAPSVPAIMSNTQPAPSAPYLPHPAPGGLSSAPQPPPQLNYVTPRAIPPPPPQSLDSKAIESCQKHAKWAISALDYEDLDTARTELKKALALLGVHT